jgi:RHS repeat-associated protein
MPAGSAWRCGAAARSRSCWGIISVQPPITADPVLGRRWTSLRYKAWGEQRYAEGVAPTDFRYTGQRFESLLGLHDYGARWYDSLLGRWSQPDSIVPLESQGVQAWDRYAYVNNNPVRYNDPSGHCSGNPNDPDNPDRDCWKLYNRIHKWYRNVNLYNPFIWELSELQLISDALRLARKAVGGIAAFQKVFGEFTITHGPMGSIMGALTNAMGMAPPGMNTIILSDSVFSQSNDDSIQTILHEIGHIFDFKDMGGSIYKSQTFVDLYGSGCTSGWLGCTSDGRYGPLAGRGYNADPSKTSYYGVGSSIDDFADSFATYILNINDKSITERNRVYDLERMMIIAAWVDLAKRSK